MNCPNCGSIGVELTDRITVGDEAHKPYIESDRCRLDFECIACLCLFQIYYDAVHIQIVKTFV